MKGLVEVMMMKDWTSRWTMKFDNEAAPFFSAERMVERLHKAAIFSIPGGPRARGDEMFSMSSSSQREGILIPMKM